MAKAYTEEDKKAEVKDENGRELPQWLKEAEEKVEAEKVQSFQKFSKKTIMINLVVNYGCKLILLYKYFNTFHAYRNRGY